MDSTGTAGLGLWQRSPARRCVKVRRNGESYQLPAALVHGVLLAMLAAVIGMAGALYSFGVSDAAWKSGVDERLDGLEEGVRELRSDVGLVLRHDERLNGLESWRSRHDMRHGPQL